MPASTNPIIYVRLPMDIKEAVREAAFFQRRDMQDIVADALTEYFQRYDKHGRLRSKEKILD